MKKLSTRSMVLLMGIFVFTSDVSANQSVTGIGEGKVLIQETVNDVRLIPDKFNTGCKGELTSPEALAVTINGVQLIGGSNNTRRVLDFYYRNKDITGTVCFENYDFSDYPFWGMHETAVERKVHVVFNNCKFAGVALNRLAGNVTYEFNNCSFQSVSGGNATINRCKFGGSFSDGIVPFQNVEINDCFFFDMSYISPDKEVHTDGTQIYGYNGVEVQNVSYNNCRFEIPPLNLAGSKAYINACIMLQLEYNDAKNLSFKNCIVNGGGYSIYARGKKAGFTFDNVTFDGIQYGGAAKYGLFYTDIEPSIEIKNVHRTDSLYVASVWKENGKIHLSVTNDTNQERTLKIITENGEYEKTLEACKKGSEFIAEDTYDSMPFDREIVIDDSEYIICYDATTEGYAKQIRFVNWSGKDVYLDKSVAEELVSGENDILISGSCGKTITYTLTKAGVLTLSGTGATENYHSKKFPGWHEAGYSDYVKEIVVEEGIEVLGSMIFQNCTGVEKISLPNTLKKIGQYAFRNCACVEELVLPSHIERIDRCAFGAIPSKKIYYLGDDWDNITLGDQNTWLNDFVKYNQDGKVVYRIVYVLNDTTEQPAKNENPKTFISGENISFINPTREGYDFDGWYSDVALTKKKTGIDASVTDNVKVYAKWIEKTASVPENKDDGTVDKPTQENIAPPSIVFIKSTVTVKPGKTVNNIQKVPEGTDVTYISENKKVATVNEKGVVKGINAGKTTIKASVNGITTSFEVKVTPKKIKNFQLKRKGSTGLRMSWNKDKKISGYQIVMKTGKTGKYRIVKMIKKKKTTTYTKKGLKKGKTYYLKMRAYKIIDGKKVYGAYSSVKKVKIK